MIKKILIIIILLSLTGCQANLGAKEKEWEKAGSPLKLKAPKEKILDAIEVDNISCDEDLDCVNKGKIKKYLYISDKKLAKETIEKDGKQWKEVKRTKNAVIFTEDKPKKMLGAQSATIGRFYVGSPFYQDAETGNWYQTEIATTTIEAYEEQTATTTTEIILSFLGLKATAQTTDTYAVSSGDGYVGDTHATWATLRSQTSGVTVAPTGTTGYTVSDTGGAGGIYRIWRGFLAADISEAGSSIEVTSASFNAYHGDSVAGRDVGTLFVEGSQASVSTLVGDDYDNIGSTALTDTLASKYVPTTVGWKEWEFTSAGLSYLESAAGGYAKLAMLGDHDFNNDPPPGPSVAGYFRFDTAESSNDPYIEMTFTEGGEPPATGNVNFQSEFYY